MYIKYPLTRLIFFPILRFFIKKVRGLDNLPQKGPYIVVCKHVGALDGFFLAAVIIPRVNKKVHFIASAMKIKHIWLWQKMIAEWWAGCIPFKKEESYKSVDLAVKHLNKGEIVIIYPEGYLRDYNKAEHQAKTGAARMAIWTKVPVIPVGLIYDITVRNNLPVLYQYRKSIKNTLLNPHSLEINIGQQFELSEYYDKPMSKELLRQATDQIMKEINKLSNVNNVNKY